MNSNFLLLILILFDIVCYIEISYFCIMYKTLSNIRQSLKSYYPESEISSIIRLINQHITGSSLPLALLDKNTKITEAQTREIAKIVDRLRTFEPIQYILESTEFYNLNFYLNNNVLIPRQETEELVDLIITNNQSSTSVSILDIGTGSGCIAIALKKNMPNIEIEAWDISFEALEVAKKNSKINHTHINFKQVDVLSDYPTSTIYNIIVSNPPYILEKEMVDMERNVLDFEPHNALFVPDNNPLLFYNRIADISKELLSDKGKLYFEINRAQGTDLVEMLNKKGFSNIRLIKDISKNDRMIEAQLIRI